MDSLITRQLSIKVKKISKAFDSPMPHKGWIKSVRTALGMTLKQLGAKMNVSSQAAQRLEQDELQGNPTLNSMKTAAEALNCRFVYAFIPRKPLEQLIDAQAQLKAKEIVEQVNHSMALENQSLAKKELGLQVKLVKETLKKGNLSKIWE